MSIPVVALVGRPNVGKSTIFNKLVGDKLSIIEDTPGVTRDRIYSTCQYKNYTFNLIDTGGIETGNEDFNKEIRIQASLAIDEADLIVYVVDLKDGLTNGDQFISNMLLKSNKKVIVAINKIDNKTYKDNIYEFYSLGFDEYIPISGEHNMGIIDLLEAIVKNFKEQSKEEISDEIIRFSLIGRPNVGKSSLINALLNEERVIVSNIAGTTRDAIDTPFTYEKQKFIAIDTAGMKKRGKIYENIEKYSNIRAIKAIDRSDVCLVVINAEEGIIEQDKHIAGYAEKAGKGIVIVVNKWDTVKDKTIKEYTDLIKEEFKFISYAPIVFLSALTKKRIHTLMPEIIRVHENIRKQIKTSVLNNVIMDAVSLNIPPSYKGKRLKIYFVSQQGITPPKFIFNVNSKNLVHFSYERYLENKIRESFDFEGTPIQIEFKNRREE